MRRVLTHAVAVAAGVALAVGSGAFASQNRQTDATHNRILSRLGNPNFYNAGSLAAQVGDVRRELMSVQGQLRRVCVATGTSC
jgi:hypothetical protein